jgi:hypothetical protein
MGRKAKTDRFTRTVEQRLKQRLVRSDATGCLVWTGAGNHKGVGSMGVKGETVPVQRVAWELVHGPTDLVVFHRCTNRRCCNVEHLMVGTRGDKNRFLKASGRARGAPGIRNRGAKVKVEDVRRARDLYAGGRLSQEAVGRIVGLSQSQISEIVRRQSWAHV